MTDIMDAYIKGRLAGRRYATDRQENNLAEKPDNPYGGKEALHGVEWDRGFNDGLAHGGNSEGLRLSAKGPLGLRLWAAVRHMTGFLRRA